jgi:RNA polymerase sigma factor (sigma-70 family)
MSAADAARKRSAEDCKDEIEEVSRHQGDRLLLIARYFAARARLSPEDLLQEALTRVLCGDRQRPPDVDIVAFLGGVMKSIASSEVRKRARREDAGYAETPTDLGLFADTVSDGRAGVEETICREEHDAAFHAWLYEQFDDEETQLVLLGVFEGLSGEELCVQTGVSKSQLATIRRRIRRKISEFEGRRGS